MKLKRNVARVIFEKDIAAMYNMPEYKPVKK